MFSYIRIFFFLSYRRLYINFVIYNILLRDNKRSTILWKVHLEKTTLTRSNWEKGSVKSIQPSTDILYYYIIYKTQIDFADLCSQLLVRVVFSRWAFHNKCYIFKIGEQSLLMSVEYVDICHYCILWKQICYLHNSFES